MRFILSLQRSNWSITLCSKDYPFSWLTRYFCLNAVFFWIQWDIVILCSLRSFRFSYVLSSLLTLYLFLYLRSPICDHFLSYWSISFRISFNKGLLVAHSFVCLKFTSVSLAENISAEYRILAVGLFSTHGGFHSTSVPVLLLRSQIPVSWPHLWRWLFFISPVALKLFSMSLVCN